jgi:hypothetical protein
MLAVFGVDVLDPGVSLRRVWVLLNRLPPGSLPRVSAASWSTDTHLLAGLLDAVNALTWVTVAQASRNRPAKPKPVPRPQGSTRTATDGQPGSSWADLARSLAGGQVTGGR